MSFDCALAYAIVNLGQAGQNSQCLSGHRPDGYVCANVRRLAAHRGRQPHDRHCALQRNQQGHSPLFNPARQRPPLRDQIHGPYAHRRGTPPRNRTAERTLQSAKQITPNPEIWYNFLDYNPEIYIDFVDYTYGEMPFTVVTPDNYLDLLA